MEVPASAGMSTALNFQVVENRVVTTGDFVLIAEEVNPVIRELEAHGIRVTALHSHMLRETPRLFFMHFWGVLVGTTYLVARTAVGDALTTAIAVLSLAVLALWKKCPDPLLVAIGALLGLATYRMVQPEWLLR